MTELRRRARSACWLVHANRLLSLVAAVQLVLACSGTDADGAATQPPDGQMAGSNSVSDAGAPAEGGATDPGAAAEAGASDGGAATEAGDGGDDLGRGGGAGAMSTGPDAGASGAPVLFQPASHPPFPLVTAHGGPVIQRIELVPMYFGMDPLISGLESFTKWLVGSDYWKTVGADYGVLAGSRLPSVQFSTTPATLITTEQIASWLDMQIASGVLPKPSAQTVFVMFYPAGTTITVHGSPSCSVFAGLHDSASIANAVFTGEVPFVVIPRCSFSPGDELLIATDVASHEIIEAATDPRVISGPAWKMDNDTGPLEAWQMLTGSEVADLCFNQSYDVVDGFTVQDIWSNSAAKAGNNPCQPGDPTHPFFTVSAEVDIYHALPGTTLTVPVRAWSNLPAPDWSLGINWGFVPYSDFDGHAVLSQTTVNNGDELTATVTIPSNPPVVNGRSVYRFTIDSIDPINPNFSHPWPILVVVP